MRKAVNYSLGNKSVMVLLFVDENYLQVNMAQLNLH